MDTVLLKLLRKRRSIRQFSPQQVESLKVDALIEAAVRTPTSRGRNPWEFIVVTEPELLIQLGSAKETFGKAASYEKVAKNARSWISYVSSEQDRLQQLEKSLQMADYTKSAVFVSSEEGAKKTMEDLASPGSVFIG